MDQISSMSIHKTCYPVPMILAQNSKEFLALLTATRLSPFEKRGLLMNDFIISQ